MACYDCEYAMRFLRQSIDFAEIEHDFIPLRKWANEVEKSCHELEAIEVRLKNTAGQDIIMMTLRSVASGLLSPEEAGRHIRLWLMRGHIQNAEVTQQCQFV